MHIKDIILSKLWEVDKDRRRNKTTTRLVFLERRRIIKKLKEWLKKIDPKAVEVFEEDIRKISNNRG